MHRPVQILISALYESMTDPGKTQAFIQQFAEAVGAGTGAIMVLTDLVSGRSEVLASTRVEPSFLRAYRDYYGSINVYVQRLKTLRAHPIVQPGEAICSDDELIRTEYYNDYMRPQRLHHSLGMALPLGGGLHVHVGATRSKDSGAFGAAETAVAEAVAAHLRPAVEIRERLLRAQRRAATLSLLTDALPFGILLLNASGKIVEANRGAAEILRARDGLDGVGGELRAAYPVESSALRKLLACALATSRGQGLDPGGAMRISRPSARRAYNLLVAPLHTGSPPAVDRAGFAAVLIVVIDPDRGPGGDLAAVCRLYGLTPAEGRVCALLAQGNAPQEIADELKIAMNTVRTHIKRVLSKTDTTRQAELVRLLLTSAADLRLQPPQSCSSDAHTQFG